MTPLATAMGDVFLGIDHIGLAVPALDAGVAQWQALGLRSVHRETNTGEGVDEAMLAVPGTGLFLQVLAPLSPDSPVGRFLARRGQGMQQVAFRVSDVTIAAQRLADHGIPTIHPKPAAGTAGSRIHFVHPKDAGGVLVELVEHADH